MVFRLDYKKELNQEQHAVVMRPQSSMLVPAGVGRG